MIKRHSSYVGILVLLFSVFPLKTSLAQSSGFTLEIRENKDLSVDDVVEMGTDTFAAIIRSIPPFGGQDQITNKIVRFTTNGVVDSTIIMKDSTSLYLILPVQDGGSGYLLAGNRQYDTTKAILLVKTDHQFKAIDTLEYYPFTATNFLNMIAPDGEGGYLLCGGATGIPGYGARPFAGRLNGFLGVDTFKTFSGGKLYSVAYDIIAFQDKFIHTGLGYVPDANVGDQIIVTDTQFTLDSIHVLPDDYEAAAISHSGRDSVFYIGGRAPSRKLFKPLRDLYIGTWHLRKGLIDTVVFGSYDSSNIQVFPGISSMSNYIYFGGTVNYDVPPDYGQQQSKYLVAKFDTNLNLIWQRSFEVENSYLYLKRILATSDGGCLLAGNKFDYVEHPTLPKRSVYIIKLDSNGNIVTGIDEIPKEPLSLSVYPNPASDFIRIEAPVHEEVLIELFTSTGQMVRKTRFLGQTQLSVKHLPSGIYLYRFELQDGETGYGKIVVQH